jgi:hypothetical protein
VAELRILIGSNHHAALRRQLEALLPDTAIETCYGWELHARLARADVLVVDEATLDDALLERAPGLRLVQVLGSRLERIDLEACGQRGVYVARLPGSQSAVRPLHSSELPLPELTHTIVARVAAGNVRRLARGQVPLFWVNPPSWLDAAQALYGRAVLVESRSA